MQIYHYSIIKQMKYKNSYSLRSLFIRIVKWSDINHIVVYLDDYEKLKMQ